jgi:hypothetical protein
MVYDGAISILPIYNTLGDSMMRTIHFIDDEAAIRVITADIVHVVTALDRNYAQIKYHVTKMRTPANVESNQNIISLII